LTYPIRNILLEINWKIELMSLFGRKKESQMPIFYGKVNQSIPEIDPSKIP
jgi:hypothetical protein